MKNLLRWALPWLAAACMHNPTAVYAQMLPASTGCVGDSIVTMFRPDVAADSLSRAELDAHEVVHRRQMAARMAKGATCYAALLKFTETPLQNLMAEVPAYRAQGEWLRTHTQGFVPDTYYEFTAKRLYAFYGGPGGKLPYDYILQFLRLGHAPTTWKTTDFPLPHLALTNPEYELFLVVPEELR